MLNKKSIFKNYKKEDLIIGDLVYHILYGREWIALLCKITEGYPNIAFKKPMGLVSIIPGTEHELFFTKSLTSYRISDNMGYVSMNWLYKYKGDDQ